LHSGKEISSVSYGSTSCQNEESLCSLPVPVPPFTLCTVALQRPKEAKSFTLGVYSEGCNTGCTEPGGLAKGITWCTSQGSRGGEAYQRNHRLRSDAAWLLETGRWRLPLGSCVGVRGSPSHGVLREVLGTRTRRYHYIHAHKSIPLTSRAKARRGKEGEEGGREEPTREMHPRKKEGERVTRDRVSPSLLWCPSV
jgi:hypothetical protein